MEEREERRVWKKGEGTCEGLEEGKGGVRLEREGVWEGEGIRGKEREQ